MVQKAKLMAKLKWERYITISVMNDSETLRFCGREETELTVSVKIITDVFAVRGGKVYGKNICDEIYEVHSLYGWKPYSEELHEQYSMMVNRYAAMLKKLEDEVKLAVVST